MTPPRAHEASILIPSISSFPLRLPLSRPGLDLNLSLIQPYRDFYSDSIATRVIPPSISCLQIVFPQIFGSWWTFSPLFIPPHQRRSVIQHRLYFTPNQQRLLLHHNNFRTTDWCWELGHHCIIPKRLIAIFPRLMQHHFW